MTGRGREVRGGGQWGGGGARSVAAGGAVRGRSRVAEGVVKYDTLGHQGGAGVSAFHADTVGG